MQQVSSSTVTTTDGFAATGVGILTVMAELIFVIGRSMPGVDELQVGEERWLQCPAKCSICSHVWQLVIPVTIIEVDGSLVPDIPDKVECPSCGGMYGEPDV